MMDQKVSVSELAPLVWWYRAALLFRLSQVRGSSEPKEKKEEGGKGEEEEGVVLK